MYGRRSISSTQLGIDAGSRVGPAPTTLMGWVVKDADFILKPTFMSDRG